MNNILEEFYYGRLNFMLDNEPLEYVRTLFDGTIQGYIGRINGISNNQLKSLTRQLSERYPKNIAEDIAREMVMY